MKLQLKIQQYQPDAVDSVYDGTLVSCFEQFMAPEEIRVISECSLLLAVFREDAFEYEAVHV